ncbi:ABC transporter permease [Pelagibius sp.]|uniref:ABC transporter permease n=1 Tax=Pelagibius sp. TaxID=1931238 RepID=UPI00262A3367|nr:ABC transporter permease [Pelagibius sp.]
MRRLINANATEFWLILVIFALGLFLSLTTEQFFTLVNFTDLLNTSAVNLIFAMGLVVVLIAGAIDISFAVAASVVQYVAALALMALGGGNWVLGFFIAGACGVLLGAVNAALIHHFRIISIVVTIATFNVFFGLLMFFTRGVSIYNLPGWWSDRIILWEYETASGAWAEITLPVLVMVFAVIATWLLISHSSTGRQLYAYGDNPEAARRIGISPGAVQYIAFGWLGLMLGIAGLMQVNYAQEVVPNALFGRELDVLAAVVLGGARLGGGRGTVLGCVLGVLLIAITENGLNLLGVSPYAFKMVVGGIILAAITLSNLSLESLAGRRP